MERYVTNIKDLVIQTLTNGTEIKAKAENGDALSCFQMGMIHLLGINTPIDFKKASVFLSNQSLNDAPDANRLLGFIEECEGNYSQAFKYYANASKAKRPFLNKVSKERENLQAYLKKLDLPSTSLNEEITGVLDEIINGGDSALDSKIKLAYICDDETACLEAAQAVYDAGNLFSAVSLLKKGKIDSSNSLFATIKNSYSKLGQSTHLPSSIEVIELKGNSFLTDYDSAPSYAGIMKLCKDVSTTCKKEWMNSASEKTKGIKSKYEKEETTRIKKLKEEEANRLKKQKADEAARLKKQKAEEEKALLEAQKEKAARKKKIRRIIYSVVFIVYFLCFKKLFENASGEDMSILAFIIAVIAEFATVIFGELIFGDRK